MSAVKEAVLELAQKLPDECTWDDVMYQIYVRQKIEAGIKDADEGRLTPHEQDLTKEVGTEKTRMSPSQRLAEVFDRGLGEGLESLSAEERDLYLIQDFIIELEMNGLSGYFYNRLPELGQISSAVTAMRRYGLSDLAAIVNEAFQLFQEYTPGDSAGTWSDILKQYDPENRLQILEERANALDDYGLPTSVIK